MPRKLLLADDSITIQKMVATALAGTDCELIVVDNGEDAVVRAREALPDVVLADVVMPKKSGYDVCEAIKGDPLLEGTPVILLAGAFEAFDDARARTARADGHIAKPFEAGTLLAKLDSVLARTTRHTATVAPPAGSSGTGRGTARSGAELAEPDLRGARDRSQRTGAAGGALPGTDGADCGGALAAASPATDGAGAAATAEVPAPALDQGPASDLDLAGITRSLVERIAKEIIPPLVEQAIREHLDRLVKQRPV
jgi:CheY-like chemotaxis protein